MTGTSPPLVVYWNNQPSPYVVDRFNAVARLSSIRFEAWFDNYREADRSWAVDADEWQFTARILGTTDGDPVARRIPLDRLRDARPDLLVSNYDRLHMVAGLMLAKPYARRTAIRCLPTWPAWTEPSRRRDLAKHLLFRSVDGAKVPGRDGADYAARFGLPRERVWPVTQSIDLPLYSSARSVDGQRRASLRQDWDVTDCAFLYVGRLWKGKGVQHLIEAFRTVVDRRPGSRLLLAGDGADEAWLRRRAEGVPGVRWLGFVQPRDLPEIYAAADVLVFPTLGDPNGLVVEEAMAAGLPLVSTSAAGDIRERLPIEAGYVVPPGDAAALVDPMLTLAADPQLRDRMGAAGVRLAARADPQSYARDFESFAHGVLDAPPRRGPAAGLTRALGVPLRAAVRRSPVRSAR